MSWQDDSDLWSRLLDSDAEQRARSLDPGSGAGVAPPDGGPGRPDTGEEERAGEQEDPHPQQVDVNVDSEQGEDGHDERGDQADKGDHAHHLPPHPGDVTAAILAAAEGISALEQAGDLAAVLPGQTIPFHELARVLHATESALDRLGLLRGEVRTQLAERMPGRRAETPAGVLESVLEGGSVSWDGAKVWPEVYRQARRRADRGFEPVDAALAAVREAAPDPAWRASVLARWGVKVDECREVTPARRTVRFT